MNPFAKTHKYSHAAPSSNLDSGRQDSMNRFAISHESSHGGLPSRTLVWSAGRRNTYGAFSGAFSGQGDCFPPTRRWLMAPMVAAWT
jgi:hypothetical protein